MRAAHGRPPALGGWLPLALLLALPTLLPLLAVAASFTRVDAELWAHFRHYLLPQVTANTLWLLAGVGLGVSLLGTLLAALVALTEFPGRRFFSWALLLPLAIPGYVLATVVIGLLDWSGPLAVVLREAGYGLPDIRSRGGVILTLSGALYPYVYLVARNAFASQGVRTMEAARLLGHSPLAAFWRVALPQALPWIAGGTLLALMETLADFGTVAAFNYDTFTTAIYKAWFALFSIDAALQLAGALIVLVLVLLALEQRLRGERRYHPSGGAGGGRRLALGRSRWLASGVCTLVFGCAFVVPAVQLLVWSLADLAALDASLAQLALNSVSLGLIAALLTVAFALAAALSARHAPGPLTRLAARIPTLGYAFPGPLLALGLFVPFAGLVQWLNLQLGLALVVQGSLLILLAAYMVRFTAVAHAPVAAGLLRIRPSVEEAARLQGVGGVRLVRQVHLPLLSGGLLSGGLLVMVDVMKEMPITLMTRPFGWDTLAVRVFELTSEGEWQRAALPALCIVAAGLLPVIWLNRGLESRHAGH
ncbi:MAG: ABC transporter permease [Gammaproteobacteria bacterium]